MIEETQLRDEIEKVIKGDVSLNALYSWLMARNWNIHKDSQPSAVALADEVEALFFDRADGRLDDRGLFDALAELVSNRIEVIEITVREDAVDVAPLVLVRAGSPTFRWDIQQNRLIPQAGITFLPAATSSWGSLQAQIA